MVLKGACPVIINIQDDILRIHALGLLDCLLEDKTTKRNIMWATDVYSALGIKYGRNEEITSDLITGRNAGVIKTRARKEMEQQSERTRQHAEVFTPLWICNKMNNYADEVWFGRKDIFFRDGIPTERVAFSEEGDWKKYVDSRRLEITCGEAPYLVSRYDVETGEAIPIKNRIGILDRKLRIVNENTETEESWLKWAERAFQATYGYEFQGDNLLIARVNLFMTFEEYMQERWQRKPTIQEYKKIARVIVWNIWQMDGLSGTIPYSKIEDTYHQMDLLEMLGMNGENKEENEQPPCRIFDWRGKGCSVEFLSLQRRG